MAVNEGQSRAEGNHRVPRDAGRAHAVVLAAYAAVIAMLAPALNACATKDDPRGGPDATLEAQNATITGSQDISGSTGDVSLVATTSSGKIASVTVLEAKLDSGSSVSSVVSGKADTALLSYNSLRGAKRVTGKILVTLDNGSSKTLDFGVDLAKPFAELTVTVRPNNTAQPGPVVADFTRKTIDPAENLVSLQVTARFRDALGNEVPGQAGEVFTRQNITGAIGVNAFNNAAAKSIGVKVEGPAIGPNGQTFSFLTDAGVVKTFVIFRK